MEVGAVSRGFASESLVTGPCTTSGRSINTYRCSAHATLKQERLSPSSSRPLANTMVCSCQALESSLYVKLLEKGLQGSLSTDRRSLVQVAATHWRRHRGARLMIACSTAGAISAPFDDAGALVSPDCLLRY